MDLNDETAWIIDSETWMMTIIDLKEQGFEGEVPNFFKESLL